MGRALAALCACAGRSAGGIKQQHKKGAADSTVSCAEFHKLRQRFGIGSDDLRGRGLSMWLYPIGSSGRAYPVGRFRRSDITTYTHISSGRVCGIGSGFGLSGVKMSEFYFCGLSSL